MPAPNIDPFANRKKAPPVPPPLSAEDKQRLVSQATGRKLPTAPAATPPPPPPTPLLRTAARPVVLPSPQQAINLPGITGQPPLPVGKVIGKQIPTAGAGASVTPQEMQVLRAVGYQDTPLPTTHEGRKQLQQVIQEIIGTQDQVTIPLDPRTPPLRVNTIPLAEVPLEKQAQFTEALSAIVNSEQLRQAAAVSQQKAQALEAMSPGIGAAKAAAAQATETWEQTLDNAVASDNNPDLTMDIEEPPTPSVPAPPKPAAPSKAAQAPPDPPPVSETGANATMTTCPHCEWDLSVPGIPEPSHAEKLAFLHCWLGEKPFTKDYLLFGGQIVITFRGLTPGEVDVVWKQTYHDRGEKVLSEIDYWERLNRYRFMLQLRSIKSAAPNALVVDLPDGYSEATNPCGTGFWVTKEQEQEMLNVIQTEQLPEGDPRRRPVTGLPDIEDHVIRTVLKTEAMFKVAYRACSQFNRLAAKLEAMSEHSDFLSRTEPQS